MNEHRTSPNSDTTLTRARSGPVLFELIDKDGHALPMKFGRAEHAADRARSLWPDQEQDPDRTGKGWDIQVYSEDLPAASRASHCS